MTDTTSEQAATYTILIAMATGFIVGVFMTLWAIGMFNLVRDWP